MQPTEETIVIPSGVNAALRALAACDSLDVFMQVAADEERPTSVRKRALHKARAVLTTEAKKLERKEKNAEKNAEKRRALADAASENGFRTVTEYKRWLRGEIVEGHPLPLKYLSERHGGGLDRAIREGAPSDPECLERYAQYWRATYLLNEQLGA